MENSNRKSNCPKTCIGWIILIGVVLGGLAAYLFSIGSVPFIDKVITALAILGLVFSIVNMAVTLNCRAIRCCLRHYMPTSLGASLLLLVLSILSLGIVITPDLVSSLFLIFLLAATFFVSIFSLFALFLCFLKREN